MNSLLGISFKTLVASNGCAAGNTTISWTGEQEASDSGSVQVQSVGKDHQRRLYFVTLVGQQMVVCMEAGS